MPNDNVGVMTTTYSIDNGDGNQLCAGLQGYDAARKAAQARANDLGETVYLYAPSEVAEAEERGEEHESEAIEPETVAYSYVDGGVQRSAEHRCTTEQAIAAAVDHLDAIEHGTGYAYRAEETDSWYEVTADDMAELGGAVLAGRASAAYSLWCAGCGSEIDDPTALPRKVLLRTGTVGQHFGTCGVIHDVATGERLYEGPTRPYGFTAAAMSDAETVAEERRYVVLSDDDAIEAGINPVTGERFGDEVEE